LLLVRSQVGVQGAQFYAGKDAPASFSPAISNDRRLRDKQIFREYSGKVGQGPSQTVGRRVTAEAEA
jgi:hypothetical protein